MWTARVGKQRATMTHRLSFGSVEGRYAMSPVCAAFPSRCMDVVAGAVFVFVILRVLGGDDFEAVVLVVRSDRKSAR